MSAPRMTTSACVPAADKLVEADVVRIWLAGAYTRHGLRTEDGRRLQVDFSGIPTSLGGPDLRGARIRLDGAARSGDVEVHLNSSGWSRHGHVVDGAYGGVILHVALWRDRRGGPIERPFGGEAVPELVLDGYLADAPAELAARLRAATPRPAVAITRETLRAEGRARMESRVSRCAMIWEREDAEEAIYRDFLTALGYRRNTATFRELARRCPWRGGSTRALLEAAAATGWIRFGVRPQNAPEVRLDRAVGILETARRDGWRAMIARAVGDLEGPAKDVGPSRAQAVAWSVFAPAAIVMARSRGNAAAEARVYEEYFARPDLGRDRPTRWGMARWGIAGPLSAGEAAGVRALARREAAPSV